MKKHTHFIEQTNTKNGDVRNYGPLMIEYLTESIAVTAEMPTQRTVAVFKIKIKNKRLW